MQNKIVKVIDEIIEKLNWVRDNIPEEAFDDWEDYKREEQLRDAREEEKAEQAKPKITLEDVRKVLVEAARSGKSEQIKEILSKFNASKLSEVAEKDYEELLALVGELNAS